MRWLATFAVSASVITAPAPAAAAALEPGADQARLVEQFLTPRAKEPASPRQLYTAGSTGEWSAHPVVPNTTAATAKKTTAVKPPAKNVKPAVRKKPAPKTKPVVKPKPVTVVAAPASSRVNTVVNFALAQVGKPYRWGASGPGSYDCSGLTMASYARVGIRLAHQSGAQASAGRAVSRAQLQRGDLIVYSGHVAIALGGGKMVHAANPRTGIVVANIYGSPTGYRRLL